MYSTGLRDEMLQNDENILYSSRINPTQITENSSNNKRYDLNFDN